MKAPKKEQKLNKLKPKKKVYKVKIDYGKIDYKIVQKTSNFIKKYEGFRAKAYWDYKHYSIGYGSHSYKGATITQQEADKRLNEKVTDIIKRYKLYNYQENIQTALSAFIYNIGSPPKGYKRYLDKGYLKSLGNKMKLYNKAKGKVLGGLVKRRNDEFYLLIK